MDKVQITKEQAEAIEEVKYNGRVITTIRNHFLVCSFINEMNPLNDLKHDELVRALYIGYEIKPDFKYGDWIIYQDGKVEKILDFSTPCSAKRHATEEEIKQEKERRWWAKHGRDVWELVVGDILIDENNYKSFIFKGVDKRGSFKVGNLILKFEEVKKHFKIACFTEDRQDVND